LPDMDGLALLAAIHTRWPDIPTLLITGHGDPALPVLALRNAAYDFITKPIQREYLVTSTRRALELRRLRPQAAAQQGAPDPPARRKQQRNSDSYACRRGQRNSLSPEGRGGGEGRTPAYRSRAGASTQRTDHPHHRPRHDPGHPHLRFRRPGPRIQRRRPRAG